MAKEQKSDIYGEHLGRVRRICTSFPESSERLSHGEPTFFVRNKVFAMFANNHHNDWHIAVWVPAPPGEQAVLSHTSPERFFKPPYVGVRGWIGIELNHVGDEELAYYLRQAWQMIAPKKLQEVGKPLSSVPGTRTARPRKK
jgi:hypothetical protein